MNGGLGVIADDLTGACDVAVGLSALGRDVVITVGTPDSQVSSAGDVIVALKSRTVPSPEAARQSVQAGQALRTAGAGLIYQKYCSTFDSTDAGNIGPVADALLAQLPEGAISIGTPVTPAVGRTMHRGHLFVGDRLLSESSLARHPLTPMTDPDLVRVLGRQTPQPVGLVRIEDVRGGVGAVAARIDALTARGVGHVLVDAVVEDDLDTLAAALLASPRPVLAGGAAGLAIALARQQPPAAAPPVRRRPDGAPLMLSGSGSERTRLQVAVHRGPRFDLDVAQLLTDEENVVSAALAFVADALERGQGIPLVSATAVPDDVARVQRAHGRERAATAVERALAAIAAAAADRCGVRRILVAGGETSGAVAAALGVSSLRVRRIVDPGVAWTVASDGEGRTFDLCLKSGNFGGEHLLSAAWEEPS